MSPLFGVSKSREKWVKVFILLKFNVPFVLGMHALIFGNKMHQSLKKN